MKNNSIKFLISFLEKVKIIHCISKKFGTSTEDLQKVQDCHFERSEKSLFEMNEEIFPKGYLRTLRAKHPRSVLRTSDFAHRPKDPSGNDIFWTTPIIFVLLLFSSSLVAQKATLRWKMHDVGKIRQVINNTGSLNTAGDRSFDYSGLLNCEFPPASNEEHVSNGGIWIGAIREMKINDSITVFDTLVSVSYEETSPNKEFFPSDALWDSVYAVGRGEQINIGDPINPYWRNYKGVSDQDFICRYNDYGEVSRKISQHDPLYVDVVQTSYSWSSSPLDQIIVLNYYITSTKYNLHKVYLTSWLNSSIGYNETDFGIDDFSYFTREKMLAITEDIPGGVDGKAYSPIGRRVFPHPKQHPTDSIKITYMWYDIQDGGGNNILPVTDIERYKEISSGILKDRQPEIKQGTKDFIAVGPYELAKGDTLHFVVALIVGKGLDGVLENAATLDWLVSKNFQVPSPPPPPPLRITTDNKKIKLDWTHRSGAMNPEMYQDPNRADSSKSPFEGYRVYKSTKSKNGPWTLLAEYDTTGDAYGQNTGLQYMFTDEGLLNNLEYYYSVTSFSKPDKNFPSQESSIQTNARAVSPGPVPPKRVGEVAVVPNPYRGDIAYNSYNPPWEKPQGSRSRWMEQDRRIQFINLPAVCEIKIYTLAGDPVNTISHNDPEKGYEDWNLTSSVGQAISSGIYLFTVKDTKTGDVQVGKFVVIK